MFYGVTERRDGAWCLPRDGPRRGTVNEQISTSSGLAALFMGKQKGRQGAEVLPSAWGRVFKGFVSAGDPPLARHIPPTPASLPGGGSWGRVLLAL